LQGGNNSNILLKLFAGFVVDIEFMSKKATNQETELRVPHVAELVTEGQAYSSNTTLVAAKYGISRRARKKNI